MRMGGASLWRPAWKQRMDKVTLKLIGHLVSVSLAGDGEHGQSIRP